VHATNPQHHRQKARGVDVHGSFFHSVVRHYQPKAAIWHQSSKLSLMIYTGNQSFSVTARSLVDNGGVV
jgi:hypothetical protein